MTVDRDEVKRIAQLARLRLDIDEAGRLTGELNQILEHIRTLEEADVSQVEGQTGIPRPSGSFRPPELPPDGLPAGAPGNHAPDWREGYFVVPRLPAVEEDSHDEGTS